MCPSLNGEDVNDERPISRDFHDVICIHIWINIDVIFGKEISHAVIGEDDDIEGVGDVVTPSCSGCQETSQVSHYSIDLIDDTPGGGRVRAAYMTDFVWIRVINT